MLIQDLLEDFKDIGKLPDEVLNKGHELDPSDDENFAQVSGRIFYNVLSRYVNRDTLREHPKGMSDLTIYRVGEYLNMRCYLGKNNTSGYAITRENELVSVFSFAKSSGSAIVADAVKNGADNLNCFAYMDEDGNISGHLYNLYSKFGFKINSDFNRSGEYTVENGISIVEGVKEGEPNVIIYMKR